MIVYKKPLHETIGLKGFILILLGSHITNGFIGELIAWVGVILLAVTMISFYGEPFKRRN